jgi:hypothetical protein
MSKNDFGADDCPFCLLMKKADEINRLSRLKQAQKRGFRGFDMVEKEDGKT